MSFINKSLNNLIINKICDISGNCSVEYINVILPRYGLRQEMLIISEIMADPLPEVSLPGKEYLEITNRTEYSFNLKNWKLLTGDQNISFPDVSIQPSEIIILCSSTGYIIFYKIWESD